MNERSCRFIISCCEHLVEFIEQFGQLLAEELMRFAQAAALVKRREFQILRLNADGCGDVLANQIQPRELFGRKRDAGFGFIHEPFVEPLLHRVSEWREHGLLLQREADEGDEVGKASGLRTSFNLARRSHGEGVPETVFGPRGMVVAQLLFQFLEHLFREALFERTAVKDLQRGDLGLVLFDVIAERFQEVRSLFFCRRIETLMRDHISGDGINSLFVLLLELHDLVAQCRLVERGAGFENQFAFFAASNFWVDFGGSMPGLSRWPVRQWRRDRSRAEVRRDICARVLPPAISVICLRCAESSSRSKRASRPASVVSVSSSRLPRATPSKSFRICRSVFLQRTGIGLVAFADADGVDDDEVCFGLRFRAADGLQIGRREDAGAATFHLLEINAAAHVAQKEKALERLDVGAGSDHVDGHGDPELWR